MAKPNGVCHTFPHADGGSNTSSGEFGGSFGNSGVHKDLDKVNNHFCNSTSSSSNGVKR